MNNLKYSRQREAIKDFLISRKDHPTADVVYSNLRQQFPSISLGTVYRNLSLLVEIGEAIKVPCNDGSEHFDGCTTPHYHFECNECHSVLDLDIQNNEALLNINIIVNKNFKGTIEGNSLFFYGKCPICVEKHQHNAS